MSTQTTVNLPDEAYERASRLRMEPQADHRVSDLLENQQAVTLNDLERAELAELMKTYELGLLRQSQALAEAVRRELIPPLTPAVNLDQSLAFILAHT